MLHTDLGKAKTLGADVRALRKARGLTLSDMSDSLGRSVGWLSQVERDKSSASLDDLRQISAVLDVPMSTLCGYATAPTDEQGYIVRKTARRPVGSNKAGLIEELLSPDLTDDFEMVHSIFEAGARIVEPVIRPTQEVGYIVSGKLNLSIDGRNFTLAAGDSFRIRGEPFLWENPHDTSCVAIWVIAPPVY